jgi:hypothetical protein
MVKENVPPIHWLQLQGESLILDTWIKIWRIGLMALFTIIRVAVHGCEQATALIK